MTESVKLARMKAMVEDVETKPEQPISYLRHQELCTLFVDQCNEDLRTRGLMAVEAVVSATWTGAMLTRASITSGVKPNGEPVTIACNVTLPLPWMVDDGSSINDVMSKALAAGEAGLTEMCAKLKVLRISIAGYSKRAGRRVQAAQTIPENKGLRILTP